MLGNDDAVVETEWPAQLNPVVGDLAGFAAAVYQRGVPFLQVHARQIWVPQVGLLVKDRAHYPPGFVSFVPLMVPRDTRHRTLITSRRRHMCPPRPDGLRSGQRDAGGQLGKRGPPAARATPTALSPGRRLS